jgi:inhibitor of the pro-sigma K processing machinery
MASFKKIAQLVINSILGLVLLGVVKLLNIFPLLGFQEIEIGWLAVIVCAIAGIPGAILLMILHVCGLT